MARCGVCNTLILFGGVESGDKKYCSKRCLDKVVLRDDSNSPQAVKPRPLVGKGVATIGWAFLGIMAFLFNFGLELEASAARSAVGGSYAASMGFALMPFFFASIVVFFKEHRSLHGFFRAAAVLSILLLFSSFGKIKPPVA